MKFKDGLIMTNEIIITIDTGERFVGIFAYLKTPLQVYSKVEQLDLANKTQQDMITILINTLNDIIDIFKKHTKIDKTTIIVEDFINYNHKVNIKGYKSNPVNEMNGWIIQYCLNNNYEFGKQRAVQAKIFDNERLERLGFFKKQGKEYYLITDRQLVFIPKHTRDAFRHFIYYTNKTWFDKQITWEKVWCY